MGLVSPSGTSGLQCREDGHPVPKLWSPWTLFLAAGVASKSLVKRLGHERMENLKIGKKMGDLSSLCLEFSFLVLEV